ncbi:HNH endonuclease signature motif containing protein [Streptomonospora salina]
MPYRQWPYCTTPGCGNRTSGGRCKACLARADAARGTPTQRGYTSRWRGFAASYLRRHPWCVRPGCGRAATEVDHIDGRGPNGPRGYDEANLRPLCHDHHSARTARDQPGGWWAERRNGAA